MWNDCVNDLHPGMFIATLAENDELRHPFWIGKIVEINCLENDKNLGSLKVHWYRTLHLDAFKGKYIPEMLSQRGKVGKRKVAKNTPSIGDIILSDVDILVYDFTLTASGYLRKVTQDILRHRVPCRDDDMASPSTRGRMEARLGLHRDEDDVVVDSFEEDCSSTSSSSSSHFGSYDLSGINSNDDE